MSSSKSPPVFTTAVAAFLAHQRTLGRSYASVEYILEALRRFIVRHKADDLTASLHELWCKKQHNLSPNTLRGRQYIVRKFCLYRQRTEPLCFVPDPAFVKSRPYVEPVLITHEHVARMLDVARTLPASSGSPLRSAVVRLAVVLLYSAGLRRGELVRLRLGDVDERKGVLRICDSKFHRSRMVPLSRDAHRELRYYLRRRLAKPYDQRPEAPLLFNTHGASCRSYTGAGIAQAIDRIFVQADICDEEGRRPRVHDARHSFALTALIRSYRRGEDVQTHLPKLALYMGHVSIVSTAYYLRLIPEVATLASQRFAKGYSHLIQDGAA
jgi:integrase/recombinase XerD